jgi:hypothetical protein
MEEVTVEVIPSGHRATFRGVSAVFQMTGGPGEFTMDSAIKASILFWWLKERDKAEALQTS